jgi:hypothetical protein
VKRPLPSLLLLLSLLGGNCAPAPQVTLAIRVAPDPEGLYAGVATLDLRAVRDARVIGQHSFPATTRYLSLAEVPYGPRTVLALDGVTAAGDVIAHGATCAFDFLSGGTTATLYFAPNDFFGPTLGAPLTTRDDPLSFTQDDGTVLIMGGLDLDGGIALASTERYSPSTGRFTATTTRFNIAREEPQIAPVTNVGALVVGGLDGNGAPIETAEVLIASRGTFAQPISSPVLGPRAAHRVVRLPDGRILVIGGYATPLQPPAAHAPPLATTAVVSVQPDGSAAVQAGPPLAMARQAHAAVLAIDTVVVIGGYGVDGNPLASIEALFVDAHGDPLNWSPIATLQFPRAQSTATILQDGSILVVGGAGDAKGTPRADAEVYNPITRSTTVYPLFDARRGHTATLLADGRVLVAGGVGSDGKPLDKVELFIPGVGFVSERPLVTARREHVAVPLCDGTVLVVGGAAGAEIYTPSS